MTAPWFKLMIFWVILVCSLFFIFKCTQNTENTKIAPTLMYERLYQCAKELDQKSHAALLHQIKNNVHPNATQKELLQLLHQCRQSIPLKDQATYTQLIKSL